MEGQEAGAAARNEILRATNQAVERLSPALVGGETKMLCFKQLGERVMARTFGRQVVELQVQVQTAVHNRFTHMCTR